MKNVLEIQRSESNNELPLTNILAPPSDSLVKLGIKQCGAGSESGNNEEIGLFRVLANQDLPTLIYRS